MIGLSPSEDRLPHPLFTAGFLILLGSLMLLFLIPFAGDKFRDSKARTEFLSVKAAYGMILCGLFIVALTAVSAFSQQIITTLKGHP